MYYYIFMYEQLDTGNEVSNQTAPTAYHFDIFSGQLLVGQTAYVEHIDNGGNPADCFELAHLLTSEDIDIKGVTEYVTKNSNVDWPEDELRDLGFWLQEVVSSEPFNERLSVKVLERAYQLGLTLGGRKKILNSGYFVSIGHYLQEVKVEGAVYRGKYDKWSFIDCAEYVKSYAAEVQASGRKPRELEFIANANKGNGPSSDVMHKLTGCTISELLKCVGYVYARNWTDEDFMEWGVRFMMANGGILPSMPNIVRLSAIGRGPGMATLTRRYGFDKFQACIAERYPVAVAGLRSEFEALKRDETYGHIIKDQPNTTQSHLRSLRMVARSQLLDAAGLGLPAEDRQTLLLLNESRTFISAAARRLPDFDPDDIAIALRSPELSEIYLKAFPLNDFMTHLKVA